MAAASLGLLLSPALHRTCPPHPPRFRISACISHSVSLNPVEKTCVEIHKTGVIACLRASSAELAMEAAKAALNGGVSVLEIVVSTPGITAAGAGTSHKNLRSMGILIPGSTSRLLVNPESTSGLVDRQLLAGVGTVLNLKDAQKAINAGAKFIMSPAMIMAIMEHSHSGEALYIPGVMTPTEILTANEAGAKVVKASPAYLDLSVEVYPVSALGGTNYISALRKPFPQISMVASRGITLDSMVEYITKGASSVVLSDAIFDKVAMGQNNFSAIYQLANMASLQGIEAVKRGVLLTL